MSKRYIKEYIPLKDEFLENPFSILDSRSAQWQSRKKEWLSLGLGNECRVNLKKDKGVERERITGEEKKESSYVSVFDPYLSELMYKWFGVVGGKIIDPFCGGACRGIVAGKLGYRYTGIDIREEQIYNNKQLSRIILGDDSVEYLCGDSNEVLDSIKDNSYDMLFTCPPYFNLEKYSELDGDISNMDWDRFRDVYYSIIKKACDKLKKGSYAVIVVGDVRARNGGFYGLVPYTIKCFMDCGMMYYNEMILQSPIGSGAVRARECMRNKKIVRVHQNVLVFKKHRVVNVEKERL